ncbi:hypothetical protein IT396_03555 [Candidatus Nomurabacteria bacterium]|nr:hypothetical protein [Candidatus Nomurabacteria bacterium]
MLNPFPDLLTYSFFAPTLLRFAAACAFAYGAYFLWQNQKQIGQKRFPIIGHAPWLGGAAAVAHGILAAALAFGYHTQISALAGALGALKGIFFAEQYREVFPFSKSTYFLLLFVLLSLLLTGAGALAKDLPL